MHVSVHFNGWGDFPNPNGYTQTKIHAHFEGAFIRQNFDRGAVAADVASYVDCSCTIEDRTRMLILSSLAQVGPLYQFEKEGGFRKSDQRGVAFATARLSTGAQAVRDLIVDAWLASADAPVGHPMVNVRDIESGKVRATWELMGSD